MVMEWIWLLFFGFGLKFLIDLSNDSTKKRKDDTDRQESSS